MVCKSQTVDEMFQLAHGPNYSERKMCAVIHGYFDGSATHESSKLFSLCGFLADPRIWAELDAAWNQILDKPDWPRRPSEFHMYDCVHADNEFKGWSLAQRLAIFGDLSKALIDTNLIAIGSLCVVDAVNNCTDAERAILARAGLCSPMDFVFQVALQLAISRTYAYGQSHTPPITDGLALVFDEEPPHIAERFLELYNLHRATLHGDMLSGITFGQSHKLTPLQAADMLAYTSYHSELKKRFRGQSDFDFPIIPGFRRLIDNIAAAGGIVHHESIRTLLLTRAINEANR